MTQLTTEELAKFMHNELRALMKKTQGEYSNSIGELISFLASQIQPEFYFGQRVAVRDDETEWVTGIYYKRSDSPVCGHDVLTDDGFGHWRYCNLPYAYLSQQLKHNVDDM